MQIKPNYSALVFLKYDSGSKFNFNASSGEVPAALISEGYYLISKSNYHGNSGRIGDFMLQGKRQKFISSLYRATENGSQIIYTGDIYKTNDLLVFILEPGRYLEIFWLPEQKQAKDLILHQFDSPGSEDQREELRDNLKDSLERELEKYDEGIRNLDFGIDFHRTYRTINKPKKTARRTRKSQSV